MPMIALSAQTFDPIGHVILNAEIGGGLETLSRRITKTATLGGGAFLNDFGFSDSDRDFNFMIKRVTEDQLAVLKRLTKLYSLVNCATPDGMFSGAIENLAIGQEVKIKFIVQEKLSE